MSNVYTLYQALNNRYILSSSLGCCTTTFVTKESINWNMGYVDSKVSMNIFNEDMMKEATVVTTFTTYEELITNHPEILL